MKKTLRRGVIFVSFAVILFFLMRPFLYVERVRFSDGLALSEVGVSIVIGATHYTVTVDDRQERIPKEELDQSSLYREAIQRITPDTEDLAPSRHPELSTRRFVRWYLSPVMLLYFLVFHLKNQVVRMSKAGSREDPPFRA